MPDIDALELTVINSPESIPDWDAIPADVRQGVTKIVVGEWPTEKDAKRLTMPSLPDDFAQRFPNLTHLYLWNLVGLTELPPLACNLKTLDLRGCRDLKCVELVSTLELVDLGECRSVVELTGNCPTNLKRLYVTGCEGLDGRKLGLFLDRLKQSGNSSLMVFDATGCPAMQSLDDLPRSIIELVMKNCLNLTRLDGIGEFTRLRHFNISGCRNVTKLPDIPDTVHYLELRDCDSLDKFANQDIGKIDRENELNAARSFHSRKKFGKEVACVAFSKLLFLGDGRVGKTTLAKQLRWAELTEDQRGKAEFQHLMPRADESPTHKLRFVKWDTQLQLSTAKAEELNRLAKSEHKEPPCNQQNQIAGTIRMWDFGGQEIYHQTHRLFASAGSVFLIVWNAKETDKEKILKELPNEGFTKEEWLELNRRRSIDYWLEYVASINPKASVALVCTHCNQNADRPSWERSAPRFAATTKTLECFYVDALDQDCKNNPQFKNLVSWIRKTCGAEAEKNGIRQPAYFGQVARLVDSMLVQNQQSREANDQAQYLLMTENQWEETLVANHKEVGVSQFSLNRSDLSTITNYLHAAGSIFYLLHRTARAVLIDQEWATDLIYSMFASTGKLLSRIKNSDGLVNGDWLTSDPHWKTLRSDFERLQILQYMEQCGILVRLLSRDESRFGTELMLATEKWLLPTFESVEIQLQETIESAQRRGSIYEAFSFENTTISEFDFRALMVHLARNLGTQGVWFRNGMQAADDRQLPNWCFRIKWIPDSADSFYGKVDAVLIAPEENLDELVRQIEEVFRALGNLFQSTSRILVPRERNELDLSALYFRVDRDTDYDIAVSSRGADSAIVEQIVAEFKANGLRTKWYRDPGCRRGKLQDVLPFMESLRRPTCILLYLSDKFLEVDPENNWYCPWELADAMIQIAENKRTVERTFVLYDTVGELDSNNLNVKATSVFTELGKYFAARYAENWHDQDTFEYCNRWAKHFRRAIGPSALGEFYKRRGTFGSYSQIVINNDGTVDCSQLISEIRFALGVPGNQEPRRER